MTKHAIRVQNVHKWFGERKVLKGVTFDVREGETLVILGGSGCGKSTLLRSMIGLATPEEGSVEVLGKNICQSSEREKIEIRKQFGMLFQGAALLNSLTVGENVSLPLREHTHLAEKIIRIIMKVKLELVGLTGFQSFKPYELSGGMKKRAALARAIALDPKIIFYDEPGAGLDPITASVIDRLIMDLSRKLKITSVVVTHEMKSAFRIADRMIILHQGMVVAEGTPGEIQGSEDPYVQQFISGEMNGPISLTSNETYLKEIFSEYEN